MNNRFTDILCEYELYPHIVCAAALTPKAVAYCEKNKTKFDNKKLCFNHQSRYLKEQENKKK